jgi:hypothetical protein
MKPGKLARILVHCLIMLVILLAFAWLDWFPTVKELSGLRRDQSDLKRKIKEHSAMSARFTFPDAEERELIAGSGVELQRALPQAETDAAWLDTALRALARQVGEDHVTKALFLTNPDPDSAPEEPAALDGKTDDLGSWLVEQRREILRNFRGAADSGRFPWRFLFAHQGNPEGQKPASRPLAVALTAPLPRLLNFINHIAWNAARLEITCLRLEPGVPLAKAWLVCRGNYLSRRPSAWAVKEVAGSFDRNLLVDADSDLLWQPVNPGMVGPASKKELPPDRSGSRYVGKP